MKALKVLGTFFLGVIMFVLAIAFGVLTAGRILVSGNNISSFVKDVVKESGEVNIGEFIDKEATISTNEVTDTISKLEEYDIDVEKVYDEFGDLVSQALKYSCGVIDDIDTSKLKKDIKKAAKKYEEKTGETLDMDEIDKELDNAIKELKKEVKNTDSDDKVVLEYFGIALSNKTYFGILGGLVVCALLIVLINKSILPLCIVNIVISVLGVIANVILFVIIKVIPTEGELMMKVILNNMSHICLGVAGVFLAVIVLSIIAMVIANSNKTKKLAQ